MKLQALAPVFLDDQPVGLMGDPRPRVAKVVLAGGKRPESVRVLRGTSRDDKDAQPVALEDILDRTVEPTVPIYLRSIAKVRSGPALTNIPSLPVPPPAPLEPQYVEFPNDVPEPTLPGPVPGDPAHDGAD